MGSSSAVGMALIKLKRETGVRRGIPPVSCMHEPLENREIEVITRMNDEPLEVNFTDGPNGVQVRCGALGGGVW
jgi:hypothetical protein